MISFNTFVWFWMAVAVIVFFVLLYIKAPYGRHTTKKWGPVISNKWGWFWMELPALLIFPLLVIFGYPTNKIYSAILVVMWLLHYVNRTLIFPFKIRTTDKVMPLAIVFMAVFFNSINGFINGYWVGFLQPEMGRMPNLHMYFGAFIFIIGMAINKKADAKLIALRKEDVGYTIPQGWLFKYISCPNHLGEIIEWIGFAIAAWSLPAVAFAIWTVCNLAPRAFAHHKWYKEHFKNYPKERKALIPFVI